MVEAPRRPRGRPKQFDDQILCRLPAGTRDRIAADLKPGETQGDFLRQAILAQLRRFERRSAEETE